MFAVASTIRKQVLLLEIPANLSTKYDVDAEFLAKYGENISLSPPYDTIVVEMAAGVTITPGQNSSQKGKLGFEKKTGYTDSFTLIIPATSKIWGGGGNGGTGAFISSERSGATNPTVGYDGGDAIQIGRSFHIRILGGGDIETGYGGGGAGDVNLPHDIPGKSGGGGGGGAPSGNGGSNAEPSSDGADGTTGGGGAGGSAVDDAQAGGAGGDSVAGAVSSDTAGGDDGDAIQIFNQGATLSTLVDSNLTITGNQDLPP